jgi:hypothetical protein
MGVSKQAAQKRFVSAWEGADFSRFTQRARNVLAAADAGVAQTLAGLGLMTEEVQRLMAAEFAAVQAQRQAG